eukprot:3606106-Pleurochrysis_carterae.AAC.1
MTFGIATAAMCLRSWWQNADVSDKESDSYDPAADDDTVSTGADGGARSTNKRGQAHSGRTRHDAA